MLPSVLATIDLSIRTGLMIRIALTIILSAVVASAGLSALADEVEIWKDGQSMKTVEKERATKCRGSIHRARPWMPFPLEFTISSL